MSENPTTRDLANALRALSMDAVQAANSGHPGMPMGMADVATVLYSKFLNFDAADPSWPNRDRFILSAGHGSMLLYSLLHLTGVEECGLEDIKNFRQLGSKTAGHPEYGYLPGIETTTGPLGQGITNSVGFALAEKMLAERFGSDLVDHYTYVIAGDGCLMEGISHEAISLAGHLKLNKIIVLWDDNGITIDGHTDVAVSDDQLARFQASGWDTAACDGHDPDAIEKAIAAAKQSDKPSLIACKTTIGFGSPNKAGTHDVHGAPLGDEEIALTKKQLGWEYGAFEIPESISSAWKAIGSRGAEARKAWEAKYAAMDAAKKAEWDRRMARELPADLGAKVAEAKKTLLAEAPKMATRKSSQKALELFTAAMPELIGGSADLTGSNNTKTKATASITNTDFSGQYVHWGVREHIMAAGMNGLALHGGFRPYGGTFLVFSDYARGGIRMSALMHQPVVYVMTHDSIGLGEDGPTHQPIEHVASLRAMPGILVMRPADTVETLECWQAAIEQTNRPSLMALSRQGLAAVRTGDEDVTENKCAKGAYVVSPAKGDRQATILATGSEVEIAVAAQACLAGEGVDVAVVSMPCWELFAEQPVEYQKEVLGDAPRVSVEAGTTFGWDRWVGFDGRKVGVDTFGASGPGPQVYEHFGITPGHVVAEVKAAIQG